ncbi:MAG TPA: hypothetical protein VGN97_18940 [Mesorhizobium sp.]|jgi:plasmid stability protein|nr:hypothetical protein [Mesorhizobium sp.]
MNAINISIQVQAPMQRLSELAIEHRRTIEAEALEIIRSVLAQDMRPQRRAIADKIAAMAPKDRVQSDSVELIREMRAGASAR